MRDTNEHLRANNWLFSDYLLGLRGYGLVIYGALPASLGALGAFKPPDQATLDSKIGLVALPYICVVAVIPVVLTFVLVRQRLANWYLLPDYLSVRAFTITFAIVLVSSLVCGANGLLVGTYRFLSVAAWKALPLRDKVKPIGECLLLSFAYLVGSSTLFLTVVKEDGNLPLLPDKQEIDNLKLLRGQVKDAATNSLQSERPTMGDRELAGRITALINTARDANTSLGVLRDGFTGLGRKQFYAELSEEFSALRDAAQDVGQTNLNWQNYWDPNFNATGLNEEEKKRRASIQRLKGLCIRG